MNDYIAVDIGASSGRLVAARMTGGRLELQEIHRFSNGFAEHDGHNYWDIEYLFQEILQGLKLAKEAGIHDCTLGIDTWAVDYVLLDSEGNRLSEVYAYRDSRTQGAPDLFHKLISRETVYAKTGIQELNFNTLYQLFVHDRKELYRAERILMVPDYLYYRLSGRYMNEVTNASTMQLLNAAVREFDEDLLAAVKVRRNQFVKLTEPGEVLGELLPELVQKYQLPRCSLVVVPSHDTASAVAGVPADAKRSWAYLSSGTWSLLGVERSEPLIGVSARKANYTNEWGAYGTYRFLKNIMGLWMIQEVRKELDSTYSFAELAELAEAAPAFRSLVPCNAARFLNPDRMIGEIQSCCRESGQPIPGSPGELARCIFDSLALTYRDALQELMELTGERVNVLHIVGGGSNNKLLCRLTADLLEIEVQAGPSESTALGNIAVQMISTGQLKDLAEARELIARSFPTEIYLPDPLEGREEVLGRWQELKSRF
ncbi:rhamnulokinase [Paenibacillus sp. CAA11]|uniref:rhamnulokinase n=1 Tax=Paenibacillus sp. CAA11 TaxID=1532905 RepID=UPI000D370DB3|nr:rhamnulokinase [Paenibacillus sp. CAA11]AWB44689.1 rhamnulokinase [Paenibacillus sp. CAA11]